MKPISFYTYIDADRVRLFTSVQLPKKEGKYPTVIIRIPYVDWLEEKTEDEICGIYLKDNMTWLEHGYAVVTQHCRGRGRSDGDCIPYIYEGKDTNDLYNWIRSQSFYNGELYLKGGSYLTSVHYCAAPYSDDIKGAIFAFQDTERYNLCYRNGFFKRNLIGEWYVGMYKAKSRRKKNYGEDSFDMLPLSGFSPSLFAFVELSSYDTRSSECHPDQRITFLPEGQDVYLPSFHQLKGNPTSCNWHAECARNKCATYKSSNSLGGFTCSSSDIET